MLDNKILSLITATSEIIGLDEPFVEKDYYVTQVIHTLSNIENEYFRLVFAGGTCLAKAHQIVKRMSEDIDFKIEAKTPTLLLSKTRRLKELKQFRKLIQSKLSLPGLIADDPVVRNEGNYMRIKMQYPSMFPTASGLRPHILLEFTLSDIKLPTETLIVNALIENTLDDITLFTPPTTQCISVNETGSEKWVGLTRRVAAIDRKYHYDDATLIRHLYDLNAMKAADKITNDFCALGKSIIHKDAHQFKNQNPEYFADPASEIKHSLTLLKTQPHWKERYDNFLSSMVFETSTTKEYDDALEILEEISHIVLKQL